MAEHPESSEYIMASEMRQLLESLQPDLAYAGIPSIVPRSAAEAPEVLWEVVDRTLGAIEA
jgi:hypothetical protein